MGLIEAALSEGSNKRFIISAPFVSQLYVDQSISHDGVCLTVVSVDHKHYQVVAIPETLSKTTLSHWAPGYKVNLERAVKASSYLDGHIVQGHVDTFVECTHVQSLDGSRILGFSYRANPHTGWLAVNKGSITINGISLTVSKAEQDYFEVSLIPHTISMTNVSQVQIGTKVNLEFDIMGKYISRMIKPFLEQLNPSTR